MFCYCSFIAVIYLHASLRTRNIKNRITNKLEQLGVKRTPMGMVIELTGYEIQVLLLQAAENAALWVILKASNVIQREERQYIRHSEAKQEKPARSLNSSFSNGPLSTVLFSAHEFDKLTGIFPVNGRLVPQNLQLPCPELGKFVRWWPRRVCLELKSPLSRFKEEYA